MRLTNAGRMRQVARRVMREVPGASRSRDSAGRETDIAFDHGEFVHVPATQIAQPLQIMRSEGMNASVSALPINGWFGTHNKLAGARWIVRGLPGRELDAEHRPNDVIAPIPQLMALKDSASAPIVRLPGMTP